MKIRLNEIPENGRDYQFSRESDSALTPFLADLIQENAYKISFFIKPLNTKDFTLDGSLETQTAEQCSRCGEDFQLKISKKLREILIPEQQSERTGKYAKSPLGLTGSDAEEVSVCEYSQQQLDLGEYLHEAIAIEIPFTPYCDRCLGPDKNFHYDEKMSEEAEQTAFQKALKGLKLN